MFVVLRAIRPIWDAVETVLYVLEIRAVLHFVDVFLYKAFSVKGFQSYLGVLRLIRIDAPLQLDQADGLRLPA